MKGRISFGLLLSVSIIIGLAIIAFVFAQPSIATPTQQRSPTSLHSQNDDAVIYEAAPRWVDQWDVTTADILLIQTNDPWEDSGHYVGNNWYDGITADTRVLDTLGYSYRIATWGDIERGAVSIFAYPVVLIVNDQVQAFYDDYAAHVTDFENYVSSGHTLLFFAAGYGWANGELHAPLPGGVIWNLSGMADVAAWNVIANSSHPIVSAQLSNRIPLTDNDLYSNYCSHGWFSNLPAGTNIILRESIAEGNNPTLLEYHLGNGRVIASTLTWEHNWSYHTGGDRYGTFARKALDDVFLYAFSGGTVPADVQLELRVEDALPWVSANKSRGSYVDIVARIRGDEAYQANVVLQVPTDKLGMPVKTFTRNRPDNDGYGQENQYTNLGSGQYQISSILSRQTERYYKEIVWRFRVPDGALPERQIELSATISIPDHTVQNPTSRAKLNIIDYARSIIVTNRKLLFSKYQPNPAQNDVSPLLEEVYVQASVYNGEVFYVDLYNDTARDWDQNVNYSNENAANTVATAIDGLIDGWYNRLTKHPHWWETIKPEFLLIVGGDEIIPFYRTDDRPYGDDEHSYVHIDDNDPVGRVPQEHYLLSDNIYADVGGGKSQWEEGKLELSIGRIIGHSATVMRQFIENAWLQTPALSHAVMATRSEMHEPDTVRERLNFRHVTIYGEDNPDLTENDVWTRTQWITALEQPYQVLAYQGHGAYDGWYGTDQWRQGVTASDQPAGQINQNHPLFAVAACNFAIPTDLDGPTWQPEANDNISYKLISLGAGGILSSMGINTTAGKNKIAYGERLYNDYFRYLIDTSSWFGLVPASHYSEYFGTALLKAKQNYPSNGFPWGYIGTDKKTLMEYVYYGLPWSFFETPDNQAIQIPAGQQVPNGYAFLTSVPQAIAQNSFSKIFTATVTAYQFVPVAGFELLDIPGSDSLYSSYKPVLPVLHTTLNLPPGATVLGIELVGEHATALGQYNIPAADPPTSFHPTTGYTSTMDVSGIYPPVPRYGYQARDLGDRLEVRIAIAPAMFNVGTREVTLYDSTVLRINYSTSTPTVINALTVSKPQYQVGEIITPVANIENVGASPLTVLARVNVYDATGTLVGTVSSNSFEIVAGGSYSLQLPWTSTLEPGNYRMTLSVDQAGMPQGSTSVSFNTRAGELTSFSVPQSIRYGEYRAFDLSFTNYRSTPVTATAKVHIYNATGVEATSLLQRTLTANPGATVTTSWSWEPTGLDEAEYTVRAIIQIGNEVYTSNAYTMQVRDSSRSSKVFLSNVVKNWSSSAWVSSSDLSAHTIYALAPAPTVCQVLYAATDAGLYKSTDGGASWSPTGLNTLLVGRPLPDNAPPFQGASASATLVTSVAVDPTNPQIVYAATWGGGIYKSMNGGGAWTPVNSGLTDRYINIIIADPTQSNVVYTGGGSGGVFKTIDGGGLWSASNSGLGNREILSLAVAPGNSQVVYAGTTTTIYRSNNGGASWNATHNTAHGSTWAIAVHATDWQTVYAGLAGSGVYKSTNGGASWMPINNGLGSLDLRGLVIDPRNSQILYAGTNDRGVFYSNNSGELWVPFNTGLGNFTVKSLTLSGNNCYRLLAGTAYGVWWYRQ